MLACSSARIQFGHIIADGLHAVGEHGAQDLGAFYGIQASSGGASFSLFPGSVTPTIAGSALDIGKRSKLCEQGPHEGIRALGKVCVLHLNVQTPLSLSFPTRAR